MIAILCDMCKEPLETEYRDSEVQKGYRFKGSFVYIRIKGVFGKKQEVEESGRVYDLCQACYNKLRNLCEEVDI